jgi:hypothetical protein
MHLGLGNGFSRRKNRAHVAHVAVRARSQEGCEPAQALLEAFSIVQAPLPTNASGSGAAFQARAMRLHVICCDARVVHIRQPHVHMLMPCSASSACAYAHALLCFIRIHICSSTTARVSPCSGWTICRLALPSMSHGVSMPISDSSGEPVSVMNIAATRLVRS